MAITERRYAVFARAYEEFYERAEEIGELWLKENGRSRECIDRIEFDWASITLHTSYTCCGYPEYESHSIPASYLWDEEWIEQEKVRQAEQKRKEAEAAHARQIKAKQDAEKKRREQYLKLKEEFEGK